MGISTELEVFGWILGLLLLLPTHVSTKTFANTDGEFSFLFSLQAMVGLLGLAFWISKKEKGKTPKPIIQMLFLGQPLLSLPLPLFQRKIKSEKEKPKEKRKGIKFLIKKVRFNYCFFKKNRHHFFRTLKTIRKFVFLQKLKGAFRFGFEDPSLTGEVFGYLNMIHLFRPRRVKMAIEPFFMGRSFQGKLSGEIWIFPLGIVLSIIMSGLYLGIRYCKGYTLNLRSQS